MNEIDKREQSAMNGTGTGDTVDPKLTHQCSPAVPRKKFADHSINGVWGYTYFAQRDGRIKIGHSGAPLSRLSSLGRPLKILVIVPNTIIAEGAAHAKFAHLRVEGEWFWVAPDLLAFIEEMKAEVAKLPVKPRPVILSREIVAQLKEIRGRQREPGPSAHKTRFGVLYALVDRWAKTEDVGKKLEITKLINLNIREMREMGIAI